MNLTYVVFTVTFYLIVCDDTHCAADSAVGEEEGRAAIDRQPVSVQRLEERRSNANPMWKSLNAARDGGALAD